MKRLLALIGLLAIAATTGCYGGPGPGPFGGPGLFHRGYYGNYPYPAPTYVDPCACQPAAALPGPVAQAQPTVPLQ